MRISNLLFSVLLSVAILESLVVECQETATIAEENIAHASIDVEQEAVSVDGDDVQVAQEAETQTAHHQEQIPDEPVQAGPLIDLLGKKVYSMTIVDETSAQIHEHLTNEALAGKKVIGLYFSADWYVIDT
jgi:hypothetical protein